MRPPGAAMPPFVETKEGDSVMAQRLLTPEEHAKIVLDFLKVHPEEKFICSRDVHRPLRSSYGLRFRVTANKSSMNASTGSANQRGYPDGYARRVRKVGSEQLLVTGTKNELKEDNAMEF
jgi:hypothetical protein